MDSLKGVVIITGGYGGGKTETVINLALFMKKRGVDVQVADLDIVNLYFRTRESRALFSEHHIPCILPEKAYLHGDFPALNPAIGALFRKKEGLVLLDCGGDQAGAKIIRTFSSDTSQENTPQMLLVVNPFRPETETLEGVSRIKMAIEKGAGLKVTGIIGNANLLDETSLDTILKGYDFVRHISENEGLPVSFITAPDNLMASVRKKKLICPVLPLKRRLLPPWRI